MVRYNEYDLSSCSIQTRRNFARRLAQVLAFGGLSHFSVAKNIAYGMSDLTREDACIGGLSSADECIPPSNPDKCPGEMSPADECPENGKPPEDICNSGLSSADICVPTTRKAERSDQCQTGYSADDACPNSKPPKDTDGGDDVCPSGRLDTDECQPTGTDADGDQCPGGGPVEDTCTPEGAGVNAGDDCSDGYYGAEDDCKEGKSDNCSIIPVDDDSCPSGKNVPQGVNGGDDWCEGTIIASDGCYTGKDEDDLCEGRGGEGESDACPVKVSAPELDVCSDISDDYCTTEITGSDECFSGMVDEDECAGGVKSEDVCYKHFASSDECVSQLAGSDQGGCKNIVEDECVSYLQNSCMLIRDNDIVE